MKTKNIKMFSHDCHASDDPKLKEVLMDHGVAGFGIYWYIVEQLYLNEGCLPIKSCKAIAFILHVESEIIENIVNNYGLFESDGNKFWSSIISQRINESKLIARKRTQAINARWQKQRENEKKSDTNVSKSDTNVSKSDTNVSKSDTNVSKSDTNVSKSDTNVLVRVKKENTPITSKEKNIFQEKEKSYINITLKEKEKSSTYADTRTCAIKPKNELDTYINENLSKDFQTIVYDWLAYKKEKKKVYKLIGIKNFCKRLFSLSRGDPELARKIIEQSMANNWEGIFELKDKTYESKNTNRTGWNAPKHNIDEYKQEF